MTEAENIIIDPANRRIYYSLFQPALVRIRAGDLKENVLYRTIVNWEPRLAGPVTEIWNGFDNSRQINIADKENINYILEAYNLPTNAILIKNGARFKGNYPLKRILPIPINGYRHALHPRTECRDVQVIVSLNGDSVVGKPSVIDDSALLRVEIPVPDLTIMEKERFEFSFFIDGKYVFCEENAYSPYRYHLKTADVPEGKHDLTVLAVSSGDHAGSGSIKFTINRRRQKCCSKKSSP
jgi:hypothetical protein